MSPVFRPLSGLVPPLAAPVLSAVEGADAGPEPLSEGAKSKYTVPNPAIAAIAAAIKYLSGDAACLRLLEAFTSSSSNFAC
jgi:hypothetical protein